MYFVRFSREQHVGRCFCNRRSVKIIPYIWFFITLEIFGVTLAFDPATFSNRILAPHAGSCCVYRSLSDTDWLNCIINCHNDPICVSYNFDRSSDDLGVCEMLSCGIKSLCDQKSALIYSRGVIFQQLTSKKGTDICDPSTSTGMRSQDGNRNFSFSFPIDGGTDNYVQKQGLKFHLSQMSFCFWLKATKDRLTVFSYLSSKGCIELMLQVVDTNCLLLTIGGENKKIMTKVNDGKWHHVCTIWNNTDGAWSFFKDGVAVKNGNSLKVGYVIPSGGTFVLGQEQKPDKTFKNVPFVGELANFNIWSRSLLAIKVSKIAKGCLRGRGDVVSWSDFQSVQTNGNVKISKPSSCAK